MTREERAEVRRLDLIACDLSDKIDAIKQQRRSIQNRASKRASREENSD